VLIATTCPKRYFELLPDVVGQALSPASWD
jgi:hypothetical protein